MRINWSAQYSAIKIDDFYLMLSENLSLRISSELYQQINLAIQRRESIYQLSDMDFYSNMLFLDQLEPLLNSKVLLTDNEETDADVVWSVPDFKAPIRDISHGSQCQYSLLHQNNADLLLNKVFADTPLANVAIVWLDDYFDPRLTELIAEIRASKSHIQSLLVLKPTGTRQLIGPFISLSPNTQDSICLHCMQRSMRINQPVRFSLKPHGNQQTDFCLFPIKYNMAELNSLGKTIKSQLLDSLFESSTSTANQIIEIAANQTIQHHPITRFPQCHHCGDGSYLSKQIAKPINLADFELNPVSIVSTENGFRSQPAENTLQRLLSYVSPVCGLIQHLDRLVSNHADSNQSIHIYQSMFLKQSSLRGEQDVFSHYCLGKGLVESQSKASALCEAFERRNAQFNGDEPFIIASYKDLAHRAIQPHQLAPFSERQYRQFAQMNEDEREASLAVQPYSSVQNIAWTQAWSLTDESPCLLPTNACFAAAPTPGSEYIRWSSNGCAAGNHLSEALLQGCLEVIERDAVAIWWYNRIPLPEFSKNKLADHRRQTFDQHLTQCWDYWLLDATHDLAIPVVIAVGKHKTTDKFILGFGCHLSASIAAERALSELCQLIPVRDQNHKRFDFDAIQPQPFLYPEPQQTSSPVHHFDLSQPINRLLTELIALLKRNRLELLALNYSRPEVSLYTVKVYIPGTCNIWPQLACERLYQIPLKQHWQSQVLAETDLNPLALYL